MDTCHRELPWKCGKPPSYPRSRELPMSSCNHSLGGKYPVVPCRNNLDRQETHGIRMVMNGLREGSQWNPQEIPQEIKDYAEQLSKELRESAQKTGILPESECPPPLPTSGEGHARPEGVPVAAPGCAPQSTGDTTQASVSPVFHP
jgi:hypothetical protein